MHSSQLDWLSATQGPGVAGGLGNAKTPRTEISRGFPQVLDLHPAGFGAEHC